MALFTDNCTPRLIKVDESCGCTLTAADIVPMTSTAFENQGLTEVGMDKIIGQSKELRRTGVLQSAMSDLLMSRMRPVQPTIFGAGSGRSIIAPFFHRRQRHQINANYFVVESGAVDAAAGVGAVHAGSWKLTIINESGTFASPLVSLEAYFLPGRYITVVFKDATNVGRSVQLKVTASMNADAGGVSKALVTVEPNVTTGSWAGLDAADQAIFNPEHGLVIPLANSVDNREVWCYQDPAINTMALRLFWLQTTRETWCYDSEYVKALGDPLLSNYFRQFRSLPLTEQRRQQGYLADRVWKNSIWWGQQINEKQTEATYNQLPQVLDPRDSGCNLGFKANTIGWRQQLVDCGRKIDFAGADLDMDAVKATLYQLKRNREIDSGPVTRIDAMTDCHTADRILGRMTEYYKQKYGVDTQRYYTTGQAIKHQNLTLWNYDVYQFRDEGVELAVIHEPYFDDYHAAMPTADKTMGNKLMILDWSDLEVGLAGVMSRNTETFVQSDDYKCVIDVPVTKRTLHGKTWAAIVGDPQRHMIFENFSDNCPQISMPGCAYS